jgi:hypothetical protein
MFRTKSGHQKGRGYAPWPNETVDVVRKAGISMKTLLSRVNIVVGIRHG